MPYSIILTSEEKDEAQLLEVKEVLESIQGKYLEYQLKKGSKGSFISSSKSSDPLSEREFFSWMQEFRSGFDLGDRQILVFLTSQPIANNHFNGIDFLNRNIFVDINNWEKLLVGNHPIKYPIAFHVLISLLIVIYFKEENEAIAALHQEDMGCILDFNRSKTKVDLKLLTARICPGCMDTFLTKLPDTNLLAYFRSGLEKIRHDIVEREYYQKIKAKPIRVVIQKDYSRNSGCRFYFENIGYLQLDVAHAIVYLYFLKKKQGLYLNERAKDVYFFDHLYEELSGTRNIKLVSKLCGLKWVDGAFEAANNNAISERISRINKDISVLLGTFGLEKHYQILKRDTNKHGINHQFTIVDETGILKKVEPYLGRLRI